MYRHVRSVKSGAVPSLILSVPACAFIQEKLDRLRVVAAGRHVQSCPPAAKQKQRPKHDGGQQSPRSSIRPKHGTAASLHSLCAVASHPKQSFVLSACVKLASGLRSSFKPSSIRPSRAATTLEWPLKDAMCNGAHLHHTHQRTQPLPTSRANSETFVVCLRRKRDDQRSKSAFAP